MSDGQLWVKAGVASVVAHLLLFGASTLLPSGTRAGGAAQRDDLFTPGAVIPIEPVPVQMAQAKPSGPRPIDSARDPEQPALAPLDEPASTKPAPDGGHEPPPNAVEAESAPSEAVGLLSGHRASAHASATAHRGSGVVVDPSLLAGDEAIWREGVENPGVGSGGVQGPSAPPDPSKDFVFRNEKGKRVYKDPNGRFVATLRPDGRVDFRNKGAKASWSQIGIGDPGGLIAAAGGEDPNARLKAKLLRATFEMRLNMAVKFQKKQMDKRLARLDKDLEKIWTDGRRSLWARKELLFDRWDECEEASDVEPVEIPGFSEIDTSDLDEARQKAAGKARKKILVFIREHAPRGSAEAYTAGELAKLNARRISKQKFEPY